jgi:hypothetical protein
MTVRWTTAFLDFPAATIDQGCSFWLGVTGYTLSAPRGASGEFATLVPPQGAAYLRVQRVERSEPGCHLDLHVDEVHGAQRRAMALGAATTKAWPTLVTMLSPGGLPFCLVGAGAEHEPERPPPRVWSGGHRSRVDQFCLDIPPAAFPAEAAFWEALTGWERRAGSRPEFEYLARPDGMPLRLLLQRLDKDGDHGPCRAHLDLACDDVHAERLRHEGMGAVVTAEPSWTTLRDPAGLAYCITRRHPDTGKLGSA